MSNTGKHVTAGIGEQRLHSLMQCPELQVVFTRDEMDRKPHLMQTIPNGFEAAIAEIEQTLSKRFGIEQMLAMQTLLSPDRRLRQLRPQQRLVQPRLQEGIQTLLTKKGCPLLITLPAKLPLLGIFKSRTHPHQKQGCEGPLLFELRPQQQSRPHRVGKHT